VTLTPEVDRFMPVASQITYHFAATYHFAVHF